MINRSRSTIRRKLTVARWPSGFTRLDPFVSVQIHLNPFESTRSNDLPSSSKTLSPPSEQHETRKEGEVVLAGSNPSAEEAVEDFDENVVSGLDVVLNHQLNQTGFSNKNAFKTYLKDYSKR